MEQVSDNIVVTGIGLECSLGHNPEELWSQISIGNSKVREVDLFNIESYRCKNACIIDNDELKSQIEEYLIPVLKEDVDAIIEKYDRASIILLLASFKALADSGLESNDNLTGISLGSTLGNLTSFENFMASFIDNEEKIDDNKLHLIQRYPWHYNIRLISDTLGIKGPFYKSSNACASSTYAIGIGIDMLQSGQCKAVLAGGYDTLNQMVYSGFQKLNNMSKDVCRPFSKERTGLILGEGAGIILLEREEDAIKRGAKIYAKLNGYALNCDSQHITCPDTSGNTVSKLVNLALSKAKIDKDSVDYINAHGTASKANDVTEVRGIKKVFGTRVPMSSSKSMLGHTLGASGVLESIISILAILKKQLPPTANFLSCEEEFDLDFVRNESREVDLTTVVSNNFAFGGNNASLIIQKYQTDQESASMQN